MYLFAFIDDGLGWLLVIGWIFPFVLAGLLILLLIRWIIKYIKARKSGDYAKANKIRNLIILLLSVTFIYAGFRIGKMMWYDYTHDQNVKNVSFTIYGVQNQKYSTTGLQYSEENNTPHIEASVPTQNGNISIIQAKIDENTDKLFQPPDLCDIGKIKSYLTWTTWNKIVSEPEVKCRQIDTGKSGWILLTPTEEQSRYPEFVATNNRTIIVFTVFGESNTENASQRVLDFLNSASPVSPEKLL